MRKILKKTATLMMTAVIGVSMSYPKMTVYAGQRMQMQERYTTPKEWNYAEITAYQFDSTDKFENYLQTISIGQTLSRLSPRATPCKQLSLHTAFHGISLYC